MNIDFAHGKEKLPARCLAAIVAAIQLSGCVIVPTGIVYDDDFLNLQEVVFGGEPVGREDVLFAFGLPAEVYQDAEYLLFRSSRPSVVVVGEGADVAATRDDWLLVEFDSEAVVVAHYVARGRAPCFSNGSCLEPLGMRWFLVNAEEGIDIAGEEHTRPDSCSIYYFENGDRVQGSVLIENRDFPPPPEDTFYRWSFLEGRYLLRIEQRGWVDAEVEIDCRAGQVYHYILNPGRWFRERGSYQRDVSIESLDLEAGRKELIERKLIIH